MIIGKYLFFRTLTLLDLQNTDLMVGLDKRLQRKEGEEGGKQ